jgi:hypothetical protein
MGNQPEFPLAMTAQMTSFLEVREFRRPMTGQTARDHVEAQRRLAGIGPLFVLMKHRLSGWTKKELLRMAKEIATAKQIPRADRVARRRRDVLICWFCRCAPEFLFSPQLDPGQGPIEQIPEDEASMGGRVEFPHLPDQAFPHITEEPNQKGDGGNGDQNW